MIDHKKLDTWIKITKATADEIERIKADPLQTISQQEVDARVANLLGDFDSIFGTHFEEIFSK